MRLQATEAPNAAASEEMSVVTYVNQRETPVVEQLSPVTDKGRRKPEIVSVILRDDTLINYHVHVYKLFGAI